MPPSAAAAAAADRRLAAADAAAPAGADPRAARSPRQSAWRRCRKSSSPGSRRSSRRPSTPILIVTFGFQVARVEGQSMAPTLEDQDRLIVNKLVYRIGEPRRGDIVMLYYPLNPDKSFVKRVIAEEGDTVRIVDGRVYVNDVPLQRRLRAGRVPQPRRLGPAGDSRGLLLRDGRPPEQQLRQPPLGHGAEEVHHRQGAAALVAGADGARVLSRQA